jgi:hypothetical protein
MKTDFCVCGASCPECNYLLAGECAGCSAIKGKVFWAKYFSADVCPIYECVTIKKHLNDCGQCPDMPCNLWRDLKDPHYTDEQHAAGIAERAARLTKRHKC